MVPRRAPALLVLVLSAGCGAGTSGTVSDAEINQPYFGAGRVQVSGAVETLVTGTPPGGLDAAAVRALLRGPASYPPIRFVASEAAAAGTGPRFVLAFGTDAAGRLCRDPAPGGDPRLVAGALCLGPETLSRAVLRLDPAATPGPQLALLVDSLLPAWRRKNNDSPR